MNTAESSVVTNEGQGLFTLLRRMG